MAKGFIVLEIAIILVIALVLSVTIFVAGMINNAVIDKFDEKNVSSQYNRQAGYALDALATGFSLIIVGLFLGAAILAYFLTEHPIFAFFSIILLVVMIIISAIISNVFESFSSSSVFTSQTSQYTILTEIMSKLPIITLILGSIIIIAMFAKSREGQG